MALPGLPESIISGEMPRLARRGLSSGARGLFTKRRMMGAGLVAGAFGAGRVSGRSSGSRGGVTPNSSGGMGAANVGYGIYGQ